MNDADGDQLTLQFFLDLETTVWEALVTGDAEADRRVLAEDFLGGVYPPGFSDGTAHVAQLADGPTMRAYSLDQARLIRIAPDAVMLSYRAHYRQADGELTEVMYISSLWQRRQSAWLNTFSQDTPAAP